MFQHVERWSWIDQEKVEGVQAVTVDLVSVVMVSYLLVAVKSSGDDAIVGHYSEKDAAAYNDLMIGCYCNYSFDYLKSCCTVLALPATFINAIKSIIRKCSCMCLKIIWGHLSEFCEYS